MSVTSNGITTWDSTQPMSVHGASQAMGASLNPLVVGSHSSVAARNAAYAAEIAAGNRGMICWVDGVGWTGYDGTEWDTSLGQRVNYSNTQSFTCAPGLSDVGGWTSVSGFTGTTAGIVILGEGVYDIGAYVQNLGSVSATTTAKITVTANTRTSVGYIPVNETMGSATLVGAVSTGNLGVPIQFRHSQASAIGVSVFLSIVKVSP